MAISSTSLHSSSLASSSRATTDLTAAQQRQLQRLQQIDRDVRAHEQAHMAAGRELVTNGPSYSYTYGPDGKQYATGGEVGIDTSAERKPEDNINKGQRIRITALAPRDPSPQDYRVAAIGGRLEEQGRADLARVEMEQSGSAPSQSAGPASRGQDVEPSGDYVFLQSPQRVAQVYGASDPTETTSVSVFA